MSEIARTRRDACLKEGLELQNGSLKVRLREFSLDGRSIEADVLSPETSFLEMAANSMTFRRIPLSQD